MNLIDRTIIRTVFVVNTIGPAAAAGGFVGSIIGGIAAVITSKNIEAPESKTGRVKIGVAAAVPTALCTIAGGIAGGILAGKTAERLISKL
jgi:hypothetical protein